MSEKPINFDTLIEARMDRLHVARSAVIEAAKATYAVLNALGSEDRRRLPAVLYMALDGQCAAVEALQELEE